MESVAHRDMVALGRDFEAHLLRTKEGFEGIAWYPYRSMANVETLQKILPAEMQQALAEGSARWDMLDVGAADGELGLFFESRGAKVDFLDNPTTNFNDLAGLKALKRALEGSGELISQDIDRGIELHRTYDFVLALGLLYHLRNPMDFLMRLAHHAERMVLSTRVATQLPDGTKVGHAPVAYFLRCRESNNDPTNFWTFSPVGLEAVLKRSGWNVVAQTLTGPSPSNPVDAERDQRMFVYCERVPNWADLWRHHDF